MKQHTRFDDLVTMMATLNPDPANSPEIVKFVVSKVVLDVANYTHIPVDELPEELDPTIVALIQQTIEMHGYLTPSGEQTANVASLSEGDTSVTFKSPSQVYAELQTVNTLTDNYIATLNNFRVVKR